MPREMGPDLEAEVREGPPPPLDGFSPLAVWLDVGYDGGRIGAWVPDLGGVFTVVTEFEGAGVDAELIIR